MWLSLALFAVPFLTLIAPETCTNKEFAQCGGKGYSGEKCCQTFDNCTYVNDYYSQCEAKDLCLNPMFGQCGGMDHHDPPRPWTKANHHQTCCPDSFSCEYSSPYYSQCIFNSTSSTCATAYGQCGGEGWKGPQCCIPGYECTPDAKNPKYYSGCTPLPFCSNARYGQCGGVDADQNPWTKQFGHDSCCPADFHCEFHSKYFSQCKQNTTRVVNAVVVEKP